MIRLTPKCTIHEIMADPRYREFAAASTQCGRQVVPDAFPWRLMGRSDEEILPGPMRFTSGALMGEQAKRKMLGVIRAQEQWVREWWDWWRSWEWIANSRKPAPAYIDDDLAQAEAARAERQPQPGMLF